VPGTEDPGTVFALPSGLCELEIRSGGGGDSFEERGTGTALMLAFLGCSPQRQLLKAPILALSLFLSSGGLVLRPCVTGWLNARLRTGELVTNKAADPGKSVPSGESFG
jgi:hypothetical protein